MKEFNPSSKQIRTWEAQQEQEIASILGSKRRRTISLVYMFQTKSHVALKLIDRHSHVAHLATAFAQTEYDTNDLPNSRLEIKIDEPSLTNKNIAHAAINFLTDQFPQTKRSTIVVYRDLKKFKIGKPYTVIHPAAA